MANNSFKIKNSLNIEPTGASTSQAGDIRIRLSDKQLVWNDGASENTVPSNQASSISVTPGGSLSSTNVQAALIELDSDMYSHINATTGVHGESSSNTPSTIVARDGSGNFAAGTITATYSGNALDTLFNIVNTSDNTKKNKWDLSGMSSASTLTLAPLLTSTATLSIQALVDATGNVIVQNGTSGQIFIGTNATIGGSNSGIQYSDATTANRGQIKLHSFFNGTSIAGVSTLTSRSGTVGVNSAITAGQDYSKWTAQAAATTPGSAPISGAWAFKANSINSLTVPSDFHISLTNIAGTLGDKLYLSSEGLLRLLGYSTGIAHFDSSGNITSSLVDLAADVTGTLPSSALDPTLTALAAYNTNGLLTQTAADTFVGRTITAGSSKLSVTNGDGVSGNPTLDVVEGSLSVSNMAGVLTIAHGGTSNSTSVLAFNALSPITTKGDIISSDGTNNVRLGVGTDTYVLTADSTQASGLKWAAGGSGSGSGGINYVTNPNAETDTTGWATYADSAANVPVDGTGGTATNLTFSRSTSSPLRGTGSFLMAQANSTSLQGKGVSYDFTIDSEDQAKALSISLDYNASSTFVASDGITPPLNDGTTSTNAGNSDIEVFIYDKTNAVLIPVSPQVFAANGSNNFTFKGVFQTNSNSTSYRLILHVATTSANATGWQFKFDNVIVGPSPILQSTPVTDWQTYTPTFTNFGTVTGLEAVYRRVGGNLEVRCKFVTGTVVASEVRVSLPAGLTSADNTIIPTIQIAGPWARNLGTAGNIFNALIEPSVTYFTVGQISNSAVPLTKVTGSNFNNSETQNFTASIPIAGWYSSVQMSNDANTRVVSAIISGNPGASYTANNTIIYPTITKDTHASYNASTGKYTAPVSGYYYVQAFIDSNTAGGSLYATVDGVTQKPSMGYVSGAAGLDGGSTLVYATAGQLIDVRHSANWSAVAGTDAGLTIFKVLGPATIAATESVNARYYASATSISGSLATVVWTTKDFDSHGGMSSGIYTVPIAGKYNVAAQLAISGTFALNSQTNMVIQKNSVTVSEVLDYAGGVITADHVGVEDTINCLAGDTIRVQVSSGATGPAIISSNTKNFISITRTGN